MAEKPEKDRPAPVPGKMIDAARNETARRRSGRTPQNVLPDIPFEMPPNPLLALKKQTDNPDGDSAAPQPEDGEANQ